jgi:hypothetical protein
MPFLALGDVPSSVDFYFKSNRLFRVNWNWRPTRGFDAALARYDELLVGLRNDHPAAKVVQTSLAGERDRWHYWITGGAQLGSVAATMSVNKLDKDFGAADPPKPPPPMPTADKALVR